MHYLYRITNQLNGKVYIGQSNKETERWRQHKYYARQVKPIQYVHRAMKKYGVENFTYEVIVMCLTQEDANETEILLIQQYDSRNKRNGYNLSVGGDYGLPPKEKSRISKKWWSKPKNKRMMSTKQRNIILQKTPEEKNGIYSRVSLTLMGHGFTSEQIEKMSEAKLGKHVSPKTEFKKGSTPWNKKTPEQERDILERRLAGQSQSRISRELRVSRETIRRIISNIDRKTQ